MKILALVLMVASWPTWASDGRDVASVGEAWALNTRSNPAWGDRKYAIACGLTCTPSQGLDDIHEVERDDATSSHANLKGAVDAAQLRLKSRLNDHDSDESRNVSGEIGSRLPMND